MKKNLIARLLLIGAMIVTVVAQAQDDAGETTRTGSVNSTYPQPTRATPDDWKPHFGLLAGISNPEGSYNTVGDVGLDFGFQPYIPFGLGAEVSTNNLDAKGDGEDVQQTTLLARGTYNFGGSNNLIKYSYIGLGIGSVFTSRDTKLAGAPMIGFDIPIQDTERNFLSLGAAAKYLIIDGGAPEQLALNGAVKYWY
ncbi:MAG: hypothetical protein V4736_12475 [Bdellovibrionota bacterium]